MALWPLFAVYWYKTKSIQIATLWTILGGFMFLPVKTVVDFPMVPALGKHTIPIVSALIGCWLIKRQHILYFKGLDGIKLLAVLLIVVPFISAFLNDDVLIFGGLILPKITYYDGLSAVIKQFLFVVPFFIGRQLFKSYDCQLLMFRMLVIAGLFYSLLMLFEIRMSPQLHTWIYGYFPHTFGQQIRQGGFRPVVFIGHGLEVAFFTVMVLIASVLLWKNNVKIKNLAPRVVSFYFLALLVMCKSVASLSYGVFALLLIKFTKPKTQHQLALLLVTLGMLYPTMSIIKIFPHQALVNVAESIDANRAQSLQFRFNNEEKLLEHARERFYFGWGGWGRNRIYDEKTGKDISVTDGTWIIVFGQSGIFGFVALFGLLFLSVHRSYVASRSAEGGAETSLLAGHALLVGIIMIDQLPNSSLAPWLWMLAGGLLGRSEEIIQQAKVKIITSNVLK